MQKTIVLIVIGIIWSLVLRAQKLTEVEVNYVTTDEASNTNIINYQPGRELSWTDFKGRPVTGSDAAALTSAGFGVKLAFRRLGNNSRLVISVSCSFSKKNSWVMPANKTAYILNHEQKHFDIAYINTLVFIQRLRAANFTIANYASVIEKIYNETAQAMSRVQDEYDAETSHSRIPATQARWDEKIDDQLALVTNK